MNRARSGLSLALVCALLAGSAGASAHGASAAPSATHVTAALQTAPRYQAADAWHSSGITVANDASQGLAYLSGFAQPGRRVIFAVGAPRDAVYGVSLRYASGAPAPVVLAVYVNGLKAPPVSLPVTGGTRRWADAIARLPLRAGLNTIAYAGQGGSASSARLQSLRVIGGSILAPIGATLPYQQYEAEAARTNGTVIGPSRTFGDLAAEASGRKAVTLRGRGQYVEFTLRAAANGMTLRYSLPDNAAGTGITDSLSLYVAGHFTRRLTLTSRYAWLYGTYPFTNNPAGLGGHHFYDEVHLLFPTTLPAGATVRLQVDRGDRAPSYTIDLADFEQVPAPYAMPPGYLSLAAFGADPSGARDATAILRRAVAAAASRHLGLYIPPGVYTLNSHLILNNVTVRGAGPWYTVLHGQGVGLYGDYAANPNQTYPGNADGRHEASSNVQVYDLAIQGETTDRVDAAQVNGFGGSLGGNSIIQNVWIEHTKVGMWLDGPFSDLLVAGCRLRDLTADGLNLHDGVSNVTVEQSDVRNTGDDGLALWSDSDADSFDVFRNNTVEAPYLANNIAIYGGHQNSIIGNLLSDTLTQGGGINIGNRDYGSAVVPLSGTTLVAGNLLTRTGQVDPNWGYGVGAIWFYAQTQAMTSRIVVRGDEIDDSTQEAIMFTGHDPVSNVMFDHVKIDGAATFAFQAQTDVSASFSHVTATHLGVAGIYNCGNVFQIARGPGNAGWSKTVCDNLQSLTVAPTRG